MQNQTFCSSPAALHLLQNYFNLASMPHIGEVSDTACQSDQSVAFLDYQSALSTCLEGTLH